jgi:hypothetical protein
VWKLEFEHLISGKEGKEEERREMVLQIESPHV